MQKNSLGYPVEFIANPFGETTELAKLVSGGRIFIVADVNVVQRVGGIGTKIGRYVQTHGLELAGSPVVLSGGEKCKSDWIGGVGLVIEAALEAKIGRADTVLAIGGGAVLDVAGYVAAQLRGGVRLVRMPTTPSAMVDAAYAAYAAVDFGGVKDALRVPSVPTAVVVDPALAESVLDGVWNAGMSEAVRHAAVLDAALFKKLVKLAPDYFARKPGTLDVLVREAFASRQKKGGSDFALWSAHRLEAMSEYRLPHGYAVVTGILIDTAYAVARELMKPEDREALTGLLSGCKTFDGLSHSRRHLEQTESLLKGLNANELATGSAEIVLPSGLGKHVRETVDREMLRNVIRGLLQPQPSTAA